MKSLGIVLGPEWLPRFIFPIAGYNTAHDPQDKTHAVPAGLSGFHVLPSGDSPELKAVDLGEE